MAGKVDTPLRVLKNWTRPIVHLRKQFENRRFGLVFGSGLSTTLGIPTWNDLVSSIAKDKLVRGDKLIGLAPPRAGAPYRTEMLFEHFRKTNYKKYNGSLRTRTMDYKIASEWRRIIHKHLYMNAPKDFEEALNKHPYLKACIPLIQKTHLTVTYNFDDYLEQALLLKKLPGEKEKSRGYESVTNPWMQFRRSSAIIYHPNGVIPQQPLETPSDRLVFSEASFAEQLTGIFSGNQLGLMNHLAKNTCLFLGLSLEDETLRNVLVQSAQLSPGNYHYYIHFLNDGTHLTSTQEHAIRLANFRVYNLITLFLHADEICAFLDWINTDVHESREFVDYAQVNGIRVHFHFYLTGPMGTGKSTALNNFRNLVVLDEWLEQRPELLAKPPDTLTKPEESFVDDWIANQFRLKNDLLKNDGEGIFLLDRGPLDPLAFTKTKKWKSKAKLLLNKLCPGSARWRVQEGRVIFLQGDPEELALRMLLSAREEYTADKLTENDELLILAYGEDQIVRINTSGLTTVDVAQRLAEIIHLDEYEPICELHDRLNHIALSGCPKRG